MYKDESVCDDCVEDIAKKIPSYKIPVKDLDKGEFATLKSCKVEGKVHETEKGSNEYVAVTILSNAAKEELQDYLG